MRKPLSLLLSVSLILAVAVVGFAPAWSSDAAEDTSAEAQPSSGGNAGGSAAESVLAEGEVSVEAIVDHRQGVMSATSGHMASLAAILADGAPFEDRIEIHASALDGLLTDLPSLFPEGSEHEESGALPAVWEEADLFRERAEATSEAAAALSEVVETGDQGAMLQAFAGLGDTCGACHDTFRAD